MKKTGSILFALLLSTSVLAGGASAKTAKKKTKKKHTVTHTTTAAAKATGTMHENAKHSTGGAAPKSGATMQKK